MTKTTTDKMTDARALALLEHCICIAEDDAHAEHPEAREAIAHIAARLASTSPAPDGFGCADMARIGELIRTQDNRITDSPIFIVQQKRTRPAHPDYDNDGIVWVSDDNQEAGTEDFNTLEAKFRDDGNDEPDGWRRLAVRNEWEFVTSCFTEQGCKDYIAANGHNLSEPRIYAAGSYRNAEWRKVRKYLADLAAPQPVVEKENG